MPIDEQRCFEHRGRDRYRPQTEAEARTAEYRTAVKKRCGEFDAGVEASDGDARKEPQASRDQVARPGFGGTPGVRGTRLVGVKQASGNPIAHDGGQDSGNSTGHQNSEEHYTNLRCRLTILAVQAPLFRGALAQS